MKSFGWIVIAALAPLGLGCDARPMGAEQEELARRDVLGHIQGRDQKITIYSAPGGPRFTVRSLDGRVLAQGLTLSELAGRHPELYRIYQTSLARPVGLDSRLDLPRQPDLPDRPGPQR